MPLTDDERSKFKYSSKKRAFAVWTGELLEITYSPGIQLNRSHGKRQVIKGFTRGARLRMLRMIASINWGNVRHGLFITLTYPDECAVRTLRERSTDKYLFLRYLEKHLQRKVSVLWRSEWIDRKSGDYQGYLIPHFHLLVFGAGYLPNETVRTWWRNALDLAGPLSTDVKAAPRDARVSYYVSKYAAKLPHLDIAPYHNNMCFTGRQWGVTRRAGVPMMEARVSRCLKPDEIELAKNLGRETFSKYGEFGEGGFTMMGKERSALIREKFAAALAE